MTSWAVSHGVVDFYQSLVPVSAPYFVLERGFSYVEVSWLVAAAAFGSAVPQLVVGPLADTRQLRLLPVAGLLLAAAGTGLAGVLDGFALVLAVLLVAGTGVALYHPTAARDARTAAGNSVSAMGVFAAGGSLGTLLAPVVAAPLLAAYGLEALIWFGPVGLAAALVFLLRRRRATASRPVVAPAEPHPRPGADRPVMFAVLLVVETLRFTVSVAVATFIAVYWIDWYGAPPGLGELALTLTLGGGLVGTLLGGWLGDRFGSLRLLQLANLGLLAALLVLLLLPDRFSALAAAALVGVMVGLPFAGLVKLGQDYLPSRRATAAGLTFGLAVSAGGLLMPPLGVLADHQGPRAVLLALLALPVTALLISTRLRPPHPSDV